MLKIPFTNIEKWIIQGLKIAGRIKELFQRPCWNKKKIILTKIRF
jgi:hypothetical protein